MAEIATHQARIIDGDLRLVQMHQTEEAKQAALKAVSYFACTNNAAGAMCRFRLYNPNTKYEQKEN